MSDPAYEETERIIKIIETRISREYGKAVEEIEEKLNDYLERFKKKDETWRAWVNDVKKTDPAEYKKRQKKYEAWREQQIMVGKRWKELKQNLAEDYHNVNVIARSIAVGYMPEVYAINHNYGTFEIELGAQYNTHYTLYDRYTVERLMRDNPQLLPDPGKDLTRRIYAGLDVRWNRQQIQSVMMQSILQGESIPEIATRLANEVGEKNRNAAIRNARTMATGAQNAGRFDSYKRAEKMGIKTKKQWLATHDNRTRHSHRQIDYEIKPIDEPFSNGCEYPGDILGDAAEVYNCRCSMAAVVEGWESAADKVPDDLTDIDNDYEAWKESHEEEYNPITLPEEKGKAIKGAYIGEYRRKAASIGRGKRK